MTTESSHNYLFYSGLFLALLSSKLCGLLLLLNGLSWTNLLHADLQALEEWVEVTLAPWSEVLQIFTLSYIVIVTIETRRRARNEEKELKKNDQKPTKRRRNSFTAWHILAILLVMVLPRLLLKSGLKHSHPIIRRSLIGDDNIPQPDISPDPSLVQPEPPQTQEELVFEVAQMTCGGCGSHVRDLVEKSLDKQQQLSAESMMMFQINKVDVDWRAGVLSVYGLNVVEGVSKDAVSKVLSEDGYPTKFLYAN
ncbi:MAG: hypothetical protein SGILL_003594 [Bacillariaceae sp.]